MHNWVLSGIRTNFRNLALDNTQKLVFRKKNLSSISCIFYIKCVADRAIFRNRNVEKMWSDILNLCIYTEIFLCRNIVIYLFRNDFCMELICQVSLVGEVKTHGPTMSYSPTWAICLLSETHPAQLRFRLIAIHLSLSDAYFNSNNFVLVRLTVNLEITDYSATIICKFFKNKSY